MSFLFDLHLRSAADIRVTKKEPTTVKFPFFFNTMVVILAESSMGYPIPLLSI